MQTTEVVPPPSPSEHPVDSRIHALQLISAVCQVAGSHDQIEDARRAMVADGIAEAVRRHDDRALFDWLLESVSYQGIGDAVAKGYMDRHGRASAWVIEQDLSNDPDCPKLRGYWSFLGCRYHKGSATCAEPEHLGTCPLPRLPLRNGRLNQTAFAVFLFFRDIAAGDFVAWLDHRLTQVAREADGSFSFFRLHEVLLRPLGQIYGVSDKVLSMALSDLMLGAPDRPHWQEAGAALIAVDTLVHNWLHRTGILQRFGAEHPYGPRCYGPNGCAALIEVLAGDIDARQFNPAFPARFPRFVQRAIWSFCARDGFNICNGVRIKAQERCPGRHCPLASRCDRLVLSTTID